MSEVKIYIACFFVMFTFCDVKSGDVIFVNLTNSKIRIKIEDPNKIDYKDIFKINLDKQELYVLKVAKQYYKIAFSKVGFGDLQKYLFGIQYKNNDISITLDHDLLILIKGFSGCTDNYIQIVFEGERSKVFVNAVEDAYRIQGKISRLWSNIEKVTIEEASGFFSKILRLSPTDKKIRKYFEMIKNSKGTKWDEEIREWDAKLETLRKVFSEGRYRISNPSDGVYKKLKRIIKVCEI